MIDHYLFFHFQTFLHLEIMPNSKRKNKKNLQKNKKNKTISLHDEYVEIEEPCLSPITIHEDEEDLNDNDGSSVPSLIFTSAPASALVPAPVPTPTSALASTSTSVSALASASTSTPTPTPALAPASTPILTPISAPVLTPNILNDIQKQLPKINLKNCKLTLIPNAPPPGNSWIWSYFDQFIPIPPYKRIVKCLVEIQEDGIKECGHIMGTDSSTGNFISHLVKHHITEETHNRKIKEVSVSESKKTNQPTIIQMLRSNPAIKNRCDQKFIGILVKDQRPISIRDNIGFVEFIHEFDPNYKFPSEKQCKKLLAEGYNQVKEVLTDKIEKEVVSCSLTMDLWTSKNRSGYLGVTCAFVDNSFQLCETTLAVQYLPYPHTAENIVELLNQIIDMWKLNGKIFTITTDNGSNMVCAGHLMEGIIRLPCTAHTLQLVIGKGLMPAETLIARAKRLMLFFTSPKQTEKLIEIQKRESHLKDLQEEVYIINFIRIFKYIVIYTN